MKWSLLALVAFPFIVGCGDSETPMSGNPPPPTARAPKISLHAAAASGNAAAIQEHIEEGSNLDEPEPKSGNSPIITAAAFGKVEVAKALIAGGANVNLKNKEGSTALHTAAFFCEIEYVRLLLENGADKTIRDGKGLTAYDSVADPFEDLKPVYDYLGTVLGPVGIKFDYEHIKATRPKIAELLR